MIDAQNSMADAKWGPRHRGLRIQKVENGYKVQARFLTKGENLFSRQEDREFVYYSLEEVLVAVKGYFEMAQERLAES